MHSIDTETTGIDLYHGAKPFFVVSCDDRGSISYWEWPVNPKTRQPIIPDRHVEEIKQLIGINTDAIEMLILQNAKFDVAALSQLDDTFSREWPWNRTFDTLLAAHLLTSNRPKDLTSLAIQYLGRDIQPLEDRLEKAVQAARREARKLKKKGEKWSIAEKENHLTPSAKGGTQKNKEGKSWKFDTWLPRAIADYYSYESTHYFRTALSDYATADAEITVALYPMMMENIKIRKLGKIMDERLKLLPIAHGMEKQGVTISKTKLAQLEFQYIGERNKSEAICVNIAKGMGHNLKMPKGNTPNNSLKTFIYDVLKLEPTKSKKSKRETPSLDSEVMEHYKNSLPPNSLALKAVSEMIDKRARDTAITYMQGYKRFWEKLTLGGPDGRGHQIARPRDCGCNENSCFICNQELDYCINCGMGEIELLQYCIKTEWYRLHPSLNPTGTDTLRWSSSNPNEQNISKRKGFNLRYCFGPAPDREWYSIDAKNIELRLPAYEAGEDEMIALFERENDPPYYGSNHMLVFHLLWPELWNKAAKEVGEDKAGPHCKKLYASTYYQWIKNGNFAVQYGAVEKSNGWSTADIAYHQRYAHLKVKAKFSKMTKLNDWCIAFAEKHGYIETIPDITIDPDRGYPLLCTRTDYGSILPTVPLNYRIQGSACWWMMKAMIRVQEYLNHLNNKIRVWGKELGFITMQVHDELVIDLPKRGDPKTNEKESNLHIIKEISSIMERGGDDFGGIPTPCGIEYHNDNWSEGTTLA